MKKSLRVVVAVAVVAVTGSFSGHFKNTSFFVCSPNSMVRKATLVAAKSASVRWTPKRAPVEIGEELDLTAS